MRKIIGHARGLVSCVSFAKSVESLPLFSTAAETIPGQRCWIGIREGAALIFRGAAVRAREVEVDPPRLFVALVRKALWQHITQAQEEYARRTLACHREENPEQFRFWNGRNGRSRSRDGRHAA